MLCYYIQHRAPWLLHVVNVSTKNKNRGWIVTKTTRSVTRSAAAWWGSYLDTEGWTSSSLEEGSCRTGARAVWAACILFAPQTGAHRSAPPPGARRAQASPPFRDKESRPPAWGLPERDSSSLRIGQLSWGDPRRSGGRRLGRSLGSLSSSSSLLAREGALPVACTSTALGKTKGWTGRTEATIKSLILPLFLYEGPVFKTPPLCWINLRIWMCNKTLLTQL